MPPLLGYWDIRGLTEPIRFLLHYKGVEFEDKRYKDWDTWAGDKYDLDLDFPNLPYYIDGDIRLTQSLAILRYLARTHGLDGSTDSEKIEIEFLEQQILDIREQMARLCYSEHMEDEKDDFEKATRTQMKLWSAYFGDKKFLVGDSPTYVDFLAYETFDHYEFLLPNVYNDFPNIKEYIKGIEALPELQSYMKSPVYKRWPIYGPIAKFGGGGEEPKRV